MNVASGSGLTNSAVTVKAFSGSVTGWFLDNTENTATTFFQFFDDVAAGVTVGTTVPKYSVAVPAGASANVLGPIGIWHNEAISIAATTTYSGGSAPSSSVTYNVFYQ